MTTRDVSVTQEDFSRGEVRDVAPHLIPLDGSYLLRNQLLDEDGSTYKRGGSVWKSNTAFGSKLTALWDVVLGPGQRTVFANGSDFGVLAADDVTPVNLGSDGLAQPSQSAVLEDILFIGGGFMYAGSRKTADYSTGTITATNGSKTVTGSGTTWSTLVDAGMLLKCGTTERVYPIVSVDSTTQVTLRDAYEGTTGSGKSYAFKPIYKMVATDPYHISNFYCVVMNRLISASGNKFQFTEIDNPHTTTNTAGTSNEHTLPEGITITGAGAADTHGLIFTTGGTWVAEGLALDIVDALGNPQHRISLHSRDLILWQSQGIATWDRLLVVPAINGVFLVDGVSTPVRLSRNIDPDLRIYVESAFHPGGAAVFNSHYFLPIADDGSNIVEKTFVCRLDRASSDGRGRTNWPWSWFDNNGGKQSAYAIRVSDPSRIPLLLAAEAQSSARIADCTGFFAPASANKNDADGTTAWWEVISRDFVTGDGTDNVVRALKLRYQMTDAGSDNPQIAVLYGSGERVPASPQWDDPTGKWDSGFGPVQGVTYFPWATQGSAEFSGTRVGTLPVDDRGIEPHRVPINKRLREVRYRLLCLKPVKSLRLRSIQTVIRPSKATRR